MARKPACIIVPTVLTLLLAAPFVAGQSIGDVRAKSVINADVDLPVVDQFVADQFDLISRAKRPTDLTDPQEKLILNAKSLSNVADAAMAYSDRYTQAVLDSYQQTLAQAQSLAEKNPDMAAALSLTAVRVLAGVDNPLVLDELLKATRQDVPALRYAALLGFAGPTMSDALLGPDRDPAQAALVAEELKNLATNESDGVILVTVVEMAGAVLDVPELATVLETVVASRLERYADWTVTNELNDLTLVQTAVDFAASDLLDPEAGDYERTRNRFVLAAAQILSAAYYRYNTGVGYVAAEGQDPLVLISDGSQHQLRTLLIEGELAVLRLMDGGQSQFLRTLQRKTGDLAGPYQDLLGPTGRLNAALNLFAEGNNPLQPLPAPPAAIVENARIRATLAKRLVDPTKD